MFATMTTLAITNQCWKYIFNTVLTFEGGGGSLSQNTVACSLINRAYTTEVSSLVVVNTELKPSSQQEIAFPE